MPHLSAQRDGKSSRVAGRQSCPGHRQGRRDAAGSAEETGTAPGFTTLGERRRMGATMGASE